MTLISMKSATLTSKGQISLPKDLREFAGLKTGSKVAILSFKNRVEVRPLKDIEESMLTALASERALGKEWNTPREDKAWKDL